MPELADRERGDIRDGQEKERSCRPQLLTFEEADRLMWKVLKFIWVQTDRRQPTLYKVQHLGYIQSRILPALTEGRYVWEPGRYFACYKVTNGLLEVQEASAATGQLKQMIRALRSAAEFSGACWHRVKSGWHTFRRQEHTHA